MNNKEFKDECDKLATLEAQTHTSWGRWFIDDGMLCTWVITPPLGIMPVNKLFRYDKSIDELKTNKDREVFLKLISDKEWLGLKGIRDLQRAFKYLRKGDSLVT